LLVVWSIYRARYQVIFQDKNVLVEEILEQAKTKGFVDSMAQWFSNPLPCLGYVC